MSYKQTVLEKHPGAECEFDRDGAVWIVYSPTLPLARGTSAQQAWNRAAVAVSRPSAAKPGAARTLLSKTTGNRRQRNPMPGPNPVTSRFRKLALQPIRKRKLVEKAAPGELCLTIPESAWRASVCLGQDKPTRTRLHASMRINGVLFHCEALEVHIDDTGDFETVSNEWEDSLRSYYLACAAEGAFRTITIRGRDYAVFITPAT